MSRLGLGMRMLARCGSSWQPAGPRMTPPFSPASNNSMTRTCQNVRSFSATPLKRAQALKKAAKATSETPSKTKKVKATAVDTAAPAKKRKTKADAPAAPALAEEVTNPIKKATRVAKAKPTTAASKKPEATATTVPAAATSFDEAKAVEITTTKINAQTATPATSVTVTEAATSRSATPSASPKAPASQAKPASSTNPKLAPTRPYTPTPPRNPTPPSPQEPKMPVSTSSPEYQEAKWRWTSTLWALPLLLVTSYMLYDRLIDQFLLNRDTNNTPVERLGRVHEDVKNQEKSGA